MPLTMQHVVAIVFHVIFPKDVVTHESKPVKEINLAH